MNTQLLRTFLEVIHQESYTRAGRELFLSQPAVYQQVRTLEELVGRKLVRQRGKHVITTPEGRIIAKQARKILTEVDRLSAQAVGAIDSTSEGSVNLLVGTTFGASVAPLGVSAFHKKFPRVDVRIRVHHNPQEIDEALLRGSYDGAFHSVGRTAIGLVKRPVFKDHLIGIYRPNEGDEERTSFDAARLAKTGIICYGLPYGIREAIDAWAGDAHEVIPSIYELDDQIGIIRAVADGSGPAIVSSLCAAPFLKTGAVASADLDPPLFRWWYYVSPHGLDESPIVSLLIDEMKNAVDQVTKVAFGPASTTRTESERPVPDFARPCSPELTTALPITGSDTLSGDAADPGSIDHSVSSWLEDAL